MRFILAVVLCLHAASACLAHDTWVQTNTNIVRVGDVVHIDLMLGNHGNEHRDFKLASKISLEQATLEVVAPDGKTYDIKPQLIDTGYTPKEGFWSGRFIPGEAGLHIVSHTLVSQHGSTRGIKSGKTFFVVSESLDKVRRDNPGFDRPLGHVLEIVPQSNPVTPMGPGQPIDVKVVYEGHPLPDARVAFVPRGEELSEGFDQRFERMTDAEGSASFTPKEGNYYLVVVHHLEPDQKGDGYDRTEYSATLTVNVPQLCPCCGE